MASEPTRNYHVVFEGVGGADSNHPGVRTWTSFTDEADLQRFLEETGNRDIVVARGVTPEQAVDLSSETRLGALLVAAARESVVGEDLLSLRLLEMHLTNIGLSFPEKARRRRRLER